MAIQWQRVMFVVALTGFAAGGCNLALGLDGRDIAQGGAAAGSGRGGSGGQVSNGGNGGSGGSSCDPVTCAEASNDCATYGCMDEVGCTVVAYADQGTSCGDGECNGSGDCIPVECFNEIVDGDETDVDCGGSCGESFDGKCENEQKCLAGDDCKSNQCDADGNTCVACTDSDQCPSGQYCEAAIGHCFDKKGNGQTCDGDVECNSRYCRDGFCCNTSCGADCASCGLSGNEGTCSPHPAGTDPENDCSASMSQCTQSNCNGNMGSDACEASNGTVCAPADCSNGVATQQAECQNGSCDNPPSMQCSPYQCDGDSCANSCNANGDCASGYYCSGNACVPTKSNGGSCNSSSQCSSGNCVDGFCCNNACGGLCLSCAAITNGGANGSCGFVISNTDPYDECAGTAVCNSGMCKSRAAAPGSHSNKEP